MVIVGQIGKPYGIKGWMWVYSFTEPYTNLLAYEPWQIQVRGETLALTGLEIEERKGAYLVHIPGCDTPEDARRYTNLKITVDREVLTPLAEDEFFWSDLENLTVINQDEVVLGKVDHVFETGSNEVLVVKGDRERLIPFLFGQVILKVDLKGQVIRVNWDPEF